MGLQERYSYGEVEMTISKEYELVYEDKEREEDLFANTVAIPLQELRTFGQKGKIQEYDRRAEDFRHLLLDLAKEILSPDFKGLVEGWRGLASKSELQGLTLSMACLALNKLAGASEEFLYGQPH